MPTLAGVEVDAVSVAGLETSICLPQLGCALDLGVCRPGAVHRRTVLFTHAHIDHMGALARHCATRNLFGLAPPTYALPEESRAGVDDLLAAWRRLDGATLPCTVIPARPGTEVALGKGRVARAFRSIHRVPSLGWAIHERRSRLRAAFRGRPGPEIAQARAAGAEVSEAVEVPLVAFTGDSRIEVLEREPVLQAVRLLIMELSFVDDRVPVDRARAMGHIHLDEVVARASLFQNEAVLFTHRSARYGVGEANRAIAAALPPGLRERAWLLPQRRAFRDEPLVPVPAGAVDV